MLVRVKKEEANILRELEVATYQETFGPFIKEADMAHYFDIHSSQGFSVYLHQVPSQHLHNIQVTAAESLRDFP